MTSSLAGWPKASTGRMAFVREVMASSMRFGSMFAVSGSMSTSASLARSYRVQLLHSMNGPDSSDHAATFAKSQYARSKCLRTALSRLTGPRDNTTVFVWIAPGQT